MAASLPSFFDLAPHLLRAPGQGIPTFSAGKNAGQEIVRAYSRLLDSADWISRLTPEAFRDARIAILGIPLDTGAGIRRGAAYGPRGVREALLQDPQFQAWIQDGTVIDLGDVFVNPHLLDDSMLTAAQIEECRLAMYPQASPDLRSTFPVAGLSQMKVLLSALLQLAPHLRPFVIGGDHSVAWPMTQALHEIHPTGLGIVQPDAHTDLLSSRLGVKICFGTWSFHADQLLGGNRRLVQLGIRQSGRDQAHWESTTGVKQYWASEIIERVERGEMELLITEIADGLRAAGVRKLYFSNDIDGTDDNWASATGTPAPDGLTPEFILRVIERLGAEFEFVGADIVEVAPVLGTLEQSLATCELAARYAMESFRALGARSSPR